MESIVQDIMNVAEYLDDIILTCKNDAENMQSASKDLDWIQKIIFRLKVYKYKFMQSEIIYLGHRLFAKKAHTYKSESYETNSSSNKYYKNQNVSKLHKLLWPLCLWWQS